METGILRESDLVSSQERLDTYHHPKAVAIAIIAKEERQILC